MKIKRLFLVSLILYMFLSFFFVKTSFSGEKTVSNEIVPNPFYELIDWTVEQNIGLTYLYDLSEEQSQAGFRWNLFKTKHEWLYSGLVATTNTPSIGVDLSINIGKLIEKIKGQPLIYLKHLELGYYTIWELDGWDRADGIILNVIKVEF